MSRRHQFSNWMCTAILLAVFCSFENAWTGQNAAEQRILECAAIQASQLLLSPTLKTFQTYQDLNGKVAVYSATYQSSEGRQLYLMLAADTTQSPLISYSYGPDIEKKALAESERLVKRRLDNPVYQAAFYFGFGEIWRLFTDGRDSVFVNRRPPSRILGPEEFAAHKQLLLSAKPKQKVDHFRRRQIRNEWERLANGTLIDPRQDHFIPMVEKVPDFDGHYGCTPTAAADVLGYYDAAYGYGDLIHYYFEEYDDLEEENDRTVPDLQKVLKEKLGTGDDGGTGQAQRGKSLSEAAKAQDADYDWEEYGMRIAGVWDKLKDEIDAGYPAVLSVDLPGPTIDGHSMPVLGYAENPDKIYVYDLWNSGITSYNRSYFVFKNLTWIHPPLVQNNHGLKLTTLTGGGVINAGEYNIISWDCDQPGIGRVSIYINTQGGREGHWQVLKDFNNNPGQWEWLTSDEYVGGENRIRIRWWDGNNRIAEDGSTRNFTIVDSNSPQLNSGTSIYRYLPDAAVCIAQSDQWGVVAFEKSGAAADTNILELHPDETFSNPAARDTVYKSKKWSMCAVNLGPPNPPPGPFGVQIRGRGEGRLQWVESQALDWGKSSVDRYWSTIDIVHAFHIYIDPSVSQLLTNSYVKLENDTPGDVALALFDMNKRFFGYSDRVRTADAAHAGGDETLQLDGVGTGRFLVVVRGAQEGNYRISLVNEDADMEFTQFPLDRSKKYFYSPLVGPLPESDAPWCVVGVLPIGGSRWKIEAAPQRSFRENVVSTALGYPFMNLLAVKRSTTPSDSLFLRFTRLTPSGSARIEIIDLHKESPLTDGENSPREWPAGQCFHIMPINSSKPLMNLSVAIDADYEEPVYCGIAPIEGQSVYTSSMLWGSSTAQPEGNADAREGVVLLWTSKPPAQPFSYRFKTKLLTSVEQDGDAPTSYDLKIYPNPFHDQLVALFGNKVPRNSHVEVFDVLGRRLTVPPAKGGASFSDRVVLDTRGLTPGVYFIGVSGSTSKPIRIVKIH